MRIFLPIVMILLLVGEAFSQSFQWDQSTALKRPEDQLVNSIVARLLLSREVAWSKFCRHAKVRDLAREAKVLTDLKEEGRKVGLTPDEADFFSNRRSSPRAVFRRS